VRTHTITVETSNTDACVPSGHNECQDTYSGTSSDKLRVSIIREQPLIALVHSFASKFECEALQRLAGNLENMSFSHASGVNSGHYRRSYSQNIYPASISDRVYARFSARMFDVTRTLTSYPVFPSGQEPLNVALYRDVGDEYRPHCDGQCGGGPYKPGERIATSIVYCRVADKGGQTTFTVNNLKVLPETGDMLIFGYLLNGRMAGPEVEHSGCPVRRGQKWIATQWYREVPPDGRHWEGFSRTPPPPPPTGRKGIHG